MTMHRHAVVVVGGGMVGIATVLALRHAGIETALVEPSPPAAWQQDDIDLRVSAISPASENLIRALGAWEHILRRRASPFEQMQVWEQPGRECLSFSSAEFASHRLGHIIENNLLTAALWERLGGAGIYASSLESVDEVEDGLWLQLADGSEIKTSLLIGADGVGSRVRSLAGIAMSGSSYGQRGLVCHVRSEHEHGRVARQRFLPDGPLALLPLSDGRCSIVWSLPEREAQRLESVAVDEFSAELTAALHGAADQAPDSDLGALQVDSPRASFPLAHRHAQCYRKGRVVL